MRVKSKRRNAVDGSDCPIAKEFPVRIPPGEYIAYCPGTETGKSWGGRRDIFVRFRITQGDFSNTQLAMVCTYPKGGEIGHRHKYYQQWALANGAPPKPKEPLVPSVFVSKTFAVEVRDTVRKRQNGKAVADILNYSVVNTILRRFTG